MKAVRKLSGLVLINLLVALALFVLHPEFNEIKLCVLAFKGDLAADSAHFIERAYRVARSGEALYPTLFFQQHFKFIYPTSSLLAESTANAIGVSPQSFFKGFVLVSWLLTLAISAECFLVVLGNEISRTEAWQCRVLIPLLGLTFYPLLFGVVAGQVQVFLTFMFALALWFWLTGSKAAAGCCIALTCALKPPLALFLVWAALRKQWTFFWSLAVAILLIQIAAGVAFGWRNEFGYFSVLSYLSHHGEIIGENQSVNGILERVFRNGQLGYWTDTSPYPAYNAVVYAGTLVSSLLFLLVGLFLPLWRRWEDPARDFVFFALLSSIASPIVWTHHYSYFFVGGVYFLAISLKETGRIPYAFIAAYLILAHHWSVLAERQSGRWVLLSGYELYAGLAILVLLAFRVNYHPHDAVNAWQVCEPNSFRSDDSFGVK